MSRKKFAPAQENYAGTNSREIREVRYGNGGKAHVSDRLDRDLADHYGIVMIAPHRGVRRSPAQDGRPLRRYRRRWSRAAFRLAPSLSPAR